jgi:hypothetical protein
MFEETVTKVRTSEIAGGKHQVKSMLTEVSDKLLSVVIDQSTLFNGFLNGGKVGISENHVRGQFRNVGSATHGDTNVGLLQCRGIIDTITGL